MNLSCLAEHQLLAIYQKCENERTNIEKEWLFRYAIPFPYKLDIRTQIFNTEVHETIDDILAPDEVFGYAEKLRMGLKECKTT